MKKLSFWAQSNPKKAKYLIAIMQIFQLITGIYIGLSLFANDIILGNHWKYALLSLFIVALLIYPMAASNIFNFKKRKLKEGLLQFSIFFLVIVLSNQMPSKLDIEPFPKTSSFTSDSPDALLIVLKEKSSNEEKITKHNLNKKPRKRTWKKGLRQKIKQELKVMRAKKNGNGVVGVKIAFAIIVGILLSFGILILACALSCSGFTVLAGIVLLLGISSIVVGLVFLIKHIIRKHKRKQKREEKKE